MLAAFSRSVTVSGAVEVHAVTDLALDDRHRRVLDGSRVQADVFAVRPAFDRNEEAVEPADQTIVSVLRPILLRQRAPPDTVITRR